MDQSPSISSLAGALAKAQAVFTAVTKNKSAKIQMKSGGSYSYKYADLSDIWDMCRAPLTANGLAVVQSPENSSDGQIGMVTMLCHESGEWLTSYIVMRASDTSPQALGTAITYLRRYGLCSMLGIVSDEDSDGQTGQQFAQAQQHAPQRPAAQPQRPPDRPAQNGASYEPPTEQPQAQPAPADDRPKLITALRTLWSEERGLGGKIPQADYLADLDTASRDALVTLGKAARARLVKLQAQALPRAMEEADLPPITDAERAALAA